MIHGYHKEFDSAKLAAKIQTQGDIKIRDSEECGFGKRWQEVKWALTVSVFGDAVKQTSLRKEKAFVRSL